MDKISIVTSLYRSESHIVEFFERHVAVLNQLKVDYEIIFVNDGSPDNSRNVVLELIKKNPRIKLVDLSRNFGQHAAMFSGMSVAEGDYICALDSDLEEAPENLAGMYEVIKNDPSTDVVYGVLESRSGGYARKILGGLFYNLLDFLSDLRIPRDQAWQRVMTKKYVAALLKYTETNTLPAGLMILTGFNQVPFRVDKTYKGHTSYSFAKRLRLAINSITAFSSKPLILISVFGLFITAISTLCVAIIILLKIFAYDFQGGWLSVVTSIWLVGGILMVSIGVVGLYIAKIFDQVKARPLFIIKEIFQS